jgi:hypothetical protein
MADAWFEGECRGRVPITVLFDERCDLCRRLKGWLAGQATLVPIQFVAAASDEARRRFPNLDHPGSVTVLTVVAGDGAVYVGERAWLVCAWALPTWQPVAERLGTRRGLALVHLAVGLVDGYRHRRIATSYGVSCAQCQVATPPPAARRAW